VHLISHQKQHLQPKFELPTLCVGGDIGKNVRENILELQVGFG